MTLSIRPSGTDDVEQLARLRACWRETELTDEFLQRFRDWHDEERSSRHWWLAVVDDEAIGMVNLKVFNRMPEPSGGSSSWGYLGNLFVVAEHRGLGAGRALTDAVLDHARSHGFARVLLSPSELSRPLYARAGFRPADELLLHPLTD